MRIAILGTRGIPANYGGFETFAEELYVRLVERGHDVTVYCRSHHVDRSLSEYRGVRLEVLPTLRTKYFDTVVHTFLCALKAAPKRFEAVLVCNAANSPFIPILTFTGTPVVVNVDGLERKRRKWNVLGRMYYQLGERASMWFATRVVTDNKVIQDYYRERYSKETTLIEYGAEIGRRPAPEVIPKYGVEPDRYVLYLSRLEPENNAAMVIDAFRGLDTDLKLLVVGDAPYADSYKAHLRDLARDDPRISFTGFVFGEDRKLIQQNARIYVHATEVGGTHPALIEAMGYGNCCLVYETPENLDVSSGTTITFSSTEDLRDKIGQTLRNDDLIADLRVRAQARAKAVYDWEMIVDQYEELFREIGRAGR